MESCAIPPELRTEQLVAYLDGEAEVAVTQHLARCPYCHNRAMAMADEQKDLLSLFLQRSCPTTDELRDYHFDLLDDAQTVAITQHLYTCPHCTHDLFALREFIGEEEEVVEPQPSPSLWGTMVERIRFLVADLIQGGAALNPAYGVRGGEVIRVLRDATIIVDNVFYQAENLLIELEIGTDPRQSKHKFILGLIVGLEDEGYVVHLWKNDQVVGTSTVNELGSFAFTGLPAGNYDLIISNPICKVLIANRTL